MVAWTLGAGVQVLARHRALRLPNGLDQGYFLQRTWQAAALETPVRTVLNTEQGHGLILGRHFEPILALFVPAIDAWPDHTTLLFGQLILLGLTLPFAWLLARRFLTGGQSVLATWVCLAMPALWQMEAQGFRTMALATPFVAGCLWAASGGRVWWTVLFSLAALSCREEVVWALLACLPWLALWRGRIWPDTTLALAAVCAAWLFLLAMAHGGPSTFWRLGELPTALFERISQSGGASHTSPHGSALFLGSWLGPSVIAALLAPLAALPIYAWWLGIQASSGLAGPEAVHLLGPAVGVMTLVLPLALRRLPKRWVTPLLCGLLVSGGVRFIRHVQPELWAWSQREPHPGGDPWSLMVHIPRDAAVLTEARFLPALAARERIYATEDWPGFPVLAGEFQYALLRSDHPWNGAMASNGYRVSRVCPGVQLWVASPPLVISGPARTPK
jgi:hypothetical protein